MRGREGAANSLIIRGMGGIRGARPIKACNGVKRACVEPKQKERKAGWVVKLKAFARQKAAIKGNLDAKRRRCGCEATEPVLGQLSALSFQIICSQLACCCCSVVAVVGQVAATAAALKLHVKDRFTSQPQPTHTHTLVLIHSPPSVRSGILFMIRTLGSFGLAKSLYDSWPKNERGEGEAKIRCS